MERVRADQGPLLASRLIGGLSARLHLVEAVREEDGDANGSHQAASDQSQCHYQFEHDGA
jgi:hypothetical protein